MSSSSTLMDSSGTSSSNAINEAAGSQQDPHPSQARISDFVSIKLSGETDYLLWKEQMMCFLEYRDMVGFIDGTIKNPTSDGDHTKNKSKYREWKKSDILVKGWIYGTLNRAVMDNVLGLDNAYEVWEMLKSTYEIYTEEEISSQEKEKVAADQAKYLPLHRAIVRGDWDKAQEFFNKDKATLTAKINFAGETPLHLAIYRRQNPRFVENLLKELPSESLPTLVDDMRFTALTRAAMVGNTKAAKMLVEKNPCLLFITDNNENNHLPILKALLNYHQETFLHLLEASKLHIGLSQHDGYQNPFEGPHGSWVFGQVIDHGYMDIAYELLCEYPNMAISETLDAPPLSYFMNNQDLYFSATRYNFYQRFIYSNVSIGENISYNDNMNPDIENPETCSTKFVIMCKRSCFYPDSIYYLDFYPYF